MSSRSATCADRTRHWNVELRHCRALTPAHASGVIRAWPKEFRKPLKKSSSPSATPRSDGHFVSHLPPAGRRLRAVVCGPEARLYHRVLHSSTAGQAEWDITRESAYHVRATVAFRDVKPKCCGLFISGGRAPGICLRQRPPPHHAPLLRHEQARRQRLPRHRDSHRRRCHQGPHRHDRRQMPARRRAGRRELREPAWSWTATSSAPACGWTTLADEGVHGDAQRYVGSEMLGCPCMKSFHHIHMHRSYHSAII